MTHRLAWRSVVAVTLMFVLSCLFVAHRVSEGAALALNASDKAFDSGDLKRALLEAKFAALESLSSSSARRSSIERLEAVAVGSESANRPKTALLAWMSLVSVSRNQPYYSGLPLAQHAEQQVTYLIDKVSTPTSVATARAGASRLVLSLTSYAEFFSRLLLLPAVILVLAGALALPTGSRGALAKASFGKASTIIVALVVATCWCVGWFVV